MKATISEVKLEALKSFFSFVSLSSLCLSIFSKSPIVNLFFFYIFDLATLRAHCRSLWMICSKPSSAQPTEAAPCHWPSNTCLTSWTSRPTNTTYTTPTSDTHGRATGESNVWNVHENPKFVGGLDASLISFRMQNLFCCLSHPQMWPLFHLSHCRYRQYILARFTWQGCAGAKLHHTPLPLLISINHRGT